MSGLAGFCSTQMTGRVEWLASARSLLNHRSSVGRELWDHPPLGLVAVSSGPSDRLEVCRKEPTTLFMWGALYNFDAVCAAYGTATAGPDGRAGALLALYLAHGMRPFKDLNGAFVLGVWDARDRRFCLMTDRLALRMAYYARVRGGLVFGSSVKPLLAHPEVSRTVDLEGVGHFLAMGHLLGEQTYYESIRWLAGGTVLTCSLETAAVTFERYWEPQIDACNNRRSLVACADELAERLAVAVRRQLTGAARIAIPVTGGLDSRTILGLTRQLRPDGAIRTYSVGHPHTWDVVLGGRLARICRTDHTPFMLFEDFMARWSEPFVWLTDGMVTAHNCWGMGLLDLIAGFADHLLLGYLGNPLTEDAKPFRSCTDLDALAEASYQKRNLVFADADLAALLQPQVARRIAGAAVRVYQRSLRKARADQLPDRHMVVDILHRQRRYISYQWTMFNSVMPVSAPFADNDVVDFQLTVPMAYRADRQAHVALICRRLPHLAAVPSAERARLPLNAGRIHRGLYWRWERFSKVQLPRWSLGVFTRHDRRAYAHYGEWMRKEPMRSYLTRTLTEGEPFLAQWCDMDEVRRIIARHMNGEVDLFRQLSALLTLELWFRRADRLRPAIATAAAGTAALARPEDDGASSREVDVSVIIPSYNRAESLRETLQGLAVQQTGGRFTYEVVVVDNASTDATPQTVQALAGRYPVPLRYVREPKQGKPFASNAGLAAACGEILVCTDDDAVGEPTWLAALWRCLQETGADAVGGKVVPQWVDVEPGRMTEQIMQHVGTIGCLDFGLQRFQMTPVSSKYWWVGSNIAIRRSTLERYGNYDERIMRADDAALYTRYRDRGVVIYYEPEAVVRHKVGKDRLTPQAIRRLFHRAGYDRAFLTPWRTYHLITILPIDWYREVCRLAFHWCRMSRDPQYFWQRFAYECRLRACWSHLLHQLQLWPSRALGLIQGRAT